MAPVITGKLWFLNYIQDMRRRSGFFCGGTLALKGVETEPQVLDAICPRRVGEQRGGSGPHNAVDFKDPANATAQFWGSKHRGHPREIRWVRLLARDHIVWSCPNWMKGLGTL